MSTDGRFHTGRVTDSHRALTGRAERIAAERDELWQLHLFAAVLADEIAANKDDATDRRDSSTPVHTTPLADHQLIDWVRGRLRELRRLSANAAALVNQVLPVVATATNREGDAIRIASVARQLARIHADALAWSADVLRHTAGSTSLNDAIGTLASVSTPLSAGLHGWASTLESRLAAVPTHGPIAGSHAASALTLRIDADRAVLQRLEAQLSALDPTFRCVLPDDLPLH